MAKRFEIRSPACLGRLIAFIGALSVDPQRPYVVEVKRMSVKRSLAANALYWKWLTQMAQYFSTPENELTKDDMHDLMRHKFLGYRTVIIGQTEITQLKSTADRDSRQFCEYMNEIDMWSADYGCLLPRPEDNEYSIWVEEENAKHRNDPYSEFEFVSSQPCTSFAEFQARKQNAMARHESISTARAA